MKLISMLIAAVFAFASFTAVAEDAHKAAAPKAEAAAPKAEAAAPAKDEAKPAKKHKKHKKEKKDDAAK